ncbi:AraC family transcriptional regulator [Phytomonospora sp. NPDC050363]|uniref:AraC family transcriptional regulator n=1 Tax=Phytomonospora sp. NPDC050363 TaxID=3155642 RepID=UPI0033F86B5F
MDPLSDVITVMRAGEPRSARVRWHAPWGQRFMTVPGSAGFQVVLQGSCWLVPREGEPVPLNTGDVLFLPHGSGHGLADSPGSVLAEPACDPRDGARFEERHAAPAVGLDRGDDPAATVTLCGAYQLDRGRTHPLLDSLPEIVHLPARVGHRPELRAAVDLLGAEIGRERPGADALIPALLDTLLLYILRAWFDERAESGAGWPAALADPAVTSALSAVHREPARPWTVETLGAVAGLSRAAFARRFTALTGQPPLSYLTWWRMTTAARLLRESDAPLSAVAARVGYRSEFAFATAFKREFGVAPGRHRRLTDARAAGR